MDEFAYPNAHVTASIVLCTRNRTEGTLRLCLGSLCRQQLENETMEIIIVDGNSDDRVLDAIPQPLRTGAVPVTHLRVGTQQSMITARHMGILASSGEYVAFIDDDCVAADAWLYSMISCLLEKRLDG